MGIREDRIMDTDTITITVTTATLPRQIAEVSGKLDSWLSSLPSLGYRSRKVREAEMVRFHWPQITYRSYLRIVEGE
jgi:hypothetical protein